MLLTPGTRIGQYEVVAVLGAGGMGEVYRARDAKLHRDVALKIVSQVFSDDRDRVARFQREARVLASLNHPHIGSIYGFEDSGETQALVLELVEGPTLSARLAEGALPSDEAVQIAGQIAAALEAAHDAGVVHRDLKPANIKLRPDGTVKVLDFGLAKALDSRLAKDEATIAAADRVSAHTERGMIIGTTAYMSPEQARGRPLDKRTDIWAFGCVLYEMLVGQPAFQGEDDSEIRARIIERELSLESLPRDTPASVKRLLHRCLQKNPAARLRDIGDALIELNDAMREISAEPGQREQRSTRSRRELIAWAGAAVSLALLAALFFNGSMRLGTEPTAATRTQVILPVDQSLDIAFRAAPIAISPDGRRIVYAAEVDGRRQLFSRDLAELEAKSIQGTAGASQPFFSPDGRWVGFFARGTLQRVALEGGSPLQVCVVARTTYGGSWGRDGTIVFADSAKGLQAVGASGGTPSPIPGGELARWPERLPESTTVLFVTGNEIVSTSLDGSVRHVVARTIADENDSAIPVIGPGQLAPVRFVPPGFLVFGHGAYRMRAAAFDPSSSRITGAPVSVLDSIYRSASGGPLYFSVSANGTLVYAPEDPRRRLVWVERNGRSTPVSSDLQAFRYPDLSPDARYAAVDVNTEERRSDIWTYDLLRQISTRLTSDVHSLMPVWHPERAELTYYREALPRIELVGVSADGTGEAEVLATLPTFGYPTSWSADGGVLLLTLDDPTTGFDLWELTVATGAMRPLLARRSTEAWASFSPDERRIAFMSDESGVEEVYVAAYPEMTAQIRVSTQGGNWPVWSAAGDVLYYRQGNAVMAVAIRTTPALEFGAPELLVQGAYDGVDGDRKFDVGPDGRFLLIERVDPAAARQLVVVQNWSAELARVAAPR